MKTLTALAIFSFSALFFISCRRDSPPQLSVICTLDGVGGGDCADPQGKYVYKSPSEMTDYWATTQTDEANFASWCWGGTPPAAAAKLATIRKRIFEAKRRFLSGDT